MNLYLKQHLLSVENYTEIQLWTCTRRWRSARAKQVRGTPIAYLLGRRQEKFIRHRKSFKTDQQKQQVS